MSNAGTNGHSKALPTMQSSFLGKGALDISKLGLVLKRACGELSDQQITEVINAAITAGAATNEDFLLWLFAESPLATKQNGNGIRTSMPRSQTEATSAPADPSAPLKPSEERIEAVVTPSERKIEAAPTAPERRDEAKPAMDAADAIVHASFSAKLQKLLSDHTYLEPGGSVWPHPLQYWVCRCRESISVCKFEEAQEYYQRIVVSLEADKKQIGEAFRRFDYNGSGQIDAGEMRHMCAYLGWGEEEAALMDLDKDGQVTLQEFQAFIGRLGGIQQLFAHRRLRISSSRRDVCDYAGIAVGARVRAHFYIHGRKSRSWREAQVLGVGIEKRSAEGMGPATLGVLLEFVFRPGCSESKRKWATRQLVPTHWVLSSVEDASVAAALREVGILDDHQAFWALLMPETEMQAVERLENCQRAALKAVRNQATASHEQALPKLQEKFTALGYEERDLQAVFSWVQDLAPVVVHVHLDRMGGFMEVDEFYRNQFETKTSCGALDPQNNTRTRWEHDLFAGAYDGAKPFDRCKYGALNVMNDYRGVVSARQYGDSYLVLKDVRLRCTFASTDSGGISGSRLAVLDKYAHVLAEYSDEELKGLITVASAAMEGKDINRTQSGIKLLRGSTMDATQEWVTFGFPELQQESGNFYFEVEVGEGSGAAQVGLLSSKFERTPFVASAVGVGDDENGWAADGQNSALWHRGESRAWEQSWPSQAVPAQYYNPWAPQPTPKPTRVLTGSVIVGVLIDLDKQEIWFSSAGEWSQAPAFTADDIPKGTALYPAISVQGRASFNFGPSFTHPPSDAEKRAWPGTPQGKVRIDNPRIGNEETLRIYKEAQIHGELSLKRNVQRLVACKKYREAPKTQRSWGLRVIGGARCAGSYGRAGAHDGKFLYKTDKDAIIYWDKETKYWHMSDAGPTDFSSWYCRVLGDASGEPPRRGWQVPDEQRGQMRLDVFQAALKAASVHPGEAERLRGLVSTKDGVAMIYRVRGADSLEIEWNKMKGTSMTADEAWTWAIAEAQRRLREEAGIPKEAVVIETSHPYPANRHSFRKEVQIDDAPGLVVHFHQKSCTLDRRARFRIFSGGLRRDDAGIGSRVELACHSSSGNKVWGTIQERTPGGIWKVQLDRRPPQEKVVEDKEKESSWPSVGDVVEACYTSGRWYGATVSEIRDDGTYLLDWSDGDTADRMKTLDKLRRPSTSASTVECRDVDDLPMYASAAKDGPCFAMCLEEPTTVTVKYCVNPDLADEQGFAPVIGDEIACFALDRSCPLTPFSIKRFQGPGPAQEQGVAVGWFLDLISSVRASPKLVDLLRGVGGAELGDPHNQVNLLLDHLFNHIDEVLVRLNVGLRSSSECTLVFSNSSSPSMPVLLPEARASYIEGATVGDEIAKLGVERGVVRVEAFSKKGPAHAAGVRTGWVLDFERTVHVNPQPSQPLPDRKAFDADPSVLLSMPGITVVFKQPNDKPTQLYQAGGAAGQGRWKSFSLPGDSAEFEFSTDGDGGDQPDKRWGVFAVVLPKEIGLTEEQGPFTITLDKSGGTKLGLDVRIVQQGESSCLRVHASAEDEPTYIGKFDHPELCASPMDIVVKMTSLSWTALGQTSSIVVERNGTDITLREVDGPTAMEGKVDEQGNISGIVIQHGVKGGSFSLKKEEMGLVQKWNAANPSKQVRASDHFIEVNGIKGSAEQMVEELQKDILLTIVVERSTGPCCNEGHSLKAMEMPWNRCDLCGAYGTQYRCAQGCDYDLCRQCHSQGDGGPLQPAGFSEFADKWVEVTEMALGVQVLPEVERDGWDEQRLRALCQRHGWEFEWMTEDGERHRRAKESQSRWHLAESAHSKKLLVESDPAEPDPADPVDPAEAKVRETARLTFVEVDDSALAALIESQPARDGEPFRGLGALMSKAGLDDQYDKAVECTTTLGIGSMTDLLHSTLFERTMSFKEEQQQWSDAIESFKDELKAMSTASTAGAPVVGNESAEDAAASITVTAPADAAALPVLRTDSHRLSGVAMGGTPSENVSPRPAPDCVKFKNLSDSDIKMVLTDASGSREAWLLSGMSSTPIFRDWSVDVTPSFNDEEKLDVKLEGGSVYVVRFQAGKVTCKAKQ